jgi:hypothetical protein
MAGTVGMFLRRRYPIVDWIVSIDGGRCYFGVGIVKMACYE